MLSWHFKYIQMHFTISGSNLLVPICFKPTYLHYCISFLRGLPISILDWTQASQSVLSHQAEDKPQNNSTFPCQLCNFKDNGPTVPHSLASHCLSDFFLLSPLTPIKSASDCFFDCRSAPGWTLESVLLLWNALSCTYAWPPSFSFPGFVQMLSQYGPDHSDENHFSAPDHRIHLFLFCFSLWNWLRCFVYFQSFLLVLYIPVVLLACIFLVPRKKKKSLKSVSRQYCF